MSRIGSVSALRELRTPQTASGTTPTNSGLDFRTDLHYGNPEVLFSGEEFTAEGTRYVSENHILGSRLQDNDAGHPRPSVVSVTSSAKIPSWRSSRHRWKFVGTCPVTMAVIVGWLGTTSAASLPIGPSTLPTSRKTESFGSQADRRKER